MKHSLLLIMVFLCYAECASQIEQLKNANCTEADAFLEYSCLLNLKDFLGKIDEMDVRNKNDLNEFDKSCTQFSSCLRTLQCGPEHPARKQKLKLIRTYCDSIVFISNNFTDCNTKLESQNSTCYTAWDPFPENYEKELDENKKKQMLQENCKDYFGKDNCMKKEITETCSEDEWVKFRDHFIGVGNILNDCDLNKVLKDI